MDDPTARQSWGQFFEQLVRETEADNAALLGLIARWADAQERDFPDSTRPLATWLVEQLMPQAEQQADAPQPPVG